MQTFRHIILPIAAALILTAGAAIAGDNKAAPATGAAAKKPAKKPASNLDYWLGRAKTVTTQPAAADANQPAAGEGVNPFRPKAGRFRRSDALPGVIELSNGKQLPGGLYTTVEKPWIVWSEKTKSWRRIPFVNLLSITAVVEEERNELRWRWKGMGEPERVFTGKTYPMRRMHWRFRLIDGSVVEGSTKGQPIFIEFGRKTTGPFILHERQKGKDGEKLTDLIYIRKLVISRKMMDAVIADVAKQLEKANAAAPPAGKKAGSR